jgi:AcrR family transcriptional regulator
MSSFAQHGIKAVKMDDIAQQLGISKRTLYEIYNNKELLLYEGVKNYKRQKDEMIARIMQVSPNVMDVILKLYQIKIEEFKNSNHLFYRELEKYPKVKAFFEEDREAYNQQFIKFLLRGVDEGYFCKSLDFELIAKLFSALSHFAWSTQLYEEYSMEHILHNLIFVTLRGICTQKGIEILDEFMSK